MHKRSTTGISDSNHPNQLRCKQIDIYIYIYIYIFIYPTTDCNTRMAVCSHKYTRCTCLAMCGLSTNSGADAVDPGPPEPEAPLALASVLDLGGAKLNFCRLLPRAIAFTTGASRMHTQPMTTWCEDGSRSHNMRCEL